MRAWNSPVTELLEHVVHALGYVKDMYLSMVYSLNHLTGLVCKVLAESCLEIAGLAEQKNGL